MTSPRMVSRWFGKGIFAEIAPVMEHSARHFCPDWEIDVQRITPKKVKAHELANKSHIANTQKMEAWVEAIEQSADGDRVLLIDVDTVILQNLDDLWSEKWDVAYTTKPAHYPFNCGFVGVQVNDRSRAFIDGWRAENRRLILSAPDHMPWREKYGGINQASFGAMLDTGKAKAIPGLVLKELPCCVWNCEDNCWKHIDERARVLHIKSKLRISIFKRKSPMPDHFRAAAAHWERALRRMRDAA